MRPGIPWQVGLRFADDESPVDGRYTIFLSQREDRFEGAAARTRHKLRAQHGPAQFLQRGDISLKLLWAAVVVERDYVGLLELDSFRAAPFVAIGVLFRGAIPDTSGQRLRRIGRASPLEHPRKNLVHSLALGFAIIGRTDVNVVRLIPQVPAEDARIVGECPYDSCNVRFKPRIL